MVAFYHFVDVNGMIREKYRSLKCSTKHSLKMSLKYSLKVSLKNLENSDILVASNRFDDET